MKLKPFTAAVAVSDELVRQDRQRAFEMALGLIDDAELIGPRGGRYRRVGPVGTAVLDTDARGHWFVTARLQARYVRP